MVPWKCGQKKTLPPSPLPCAALLNLPKRPKKDTKQMSYKVFIKRNIPGTFLFIFSTLSIAYSVTSFNSYKYETLLPFYIALLVSSIVCITSLSAIYILKIISALIYFASLLYSDTFSTILSPYFTPIILLNIFYFFMILYPIPSEKYEDGGYPSITTSLLSTMHWRIDDGEFEFV